MLREQFLVYSKYLGVSGAQLQPQVGVNAIKSLIEDSLIEMSEILN